MATTPGKAVLEVRVLKPNGEKWHHASVYVPQFEATATFRPSTMQPPSIPIRLGG